MAFGELALDPTRTSSATIDDATEASALGAGVPG